MSAPRAQRSALATSSNAEKAAVLDELVAADQELEGRAERATRSMLEAVEVDDVADAVAAALLALDQQDLAARAGRTRYGYVEPTEAAWSLLETAFEPWLEDITRRASLGLPDAASRLGLGILEALGRIDQHTRNVLSGALSRALERRRCRLAAECLGPFSRPSSPVSLAQTTSAQIETLERTCSSVGVRTRFGRPA